ncbi:MAG TPA: cupin domain-containing protein [Acidimicrobiales bacterium]|nr:cupin domain-containing protein [Acidimicrobiales bacterium]
MISIRSAFVCVLSVTVLTFAGCGSSSDDTASKGVTTTAEVSSNSIVAPGESPTTTSTTVAVRSEVLGDLVDPPGGDGSTLSLVRYHIAPGAKLTPHIHPGVQMARIESGTLTYTIESGTALVRRAGTEADTEVSGPTTITLEAGDTVIERGDMVHFGENRSEKPLVIIATLLTADGQELAVPVTTATVAG